MPPGQTPVQRPPTSIDDVVFSKARSGVSGIGFVVADTLGIGGGSSSFCRRMYVYGMDIEFRATDALLKRSGCTCIHINGRGHCFGLGHHPSRRAISFTWRKS